MFNKIKEFFTGSKPAVEGTQEVPLTTTDAAIKNIKETTESATAKIEVAPEVTPVVAEAKPAPAKRVSTKEKPWTEKPPAPITTKPRPQTTKATTTAPRKRKPAPK
jgi:hypothetical protein